MPPANLRTIRKTSHHFRHPKFKNGTLKTEGYGTR